MKHALMGIFCVLSLALMAYVPQDPDFFNAEPGHLEPGAWIFDEMYAFYSFAPFFSHASALYWDRDRLGHPQIAGSSVDLAWDREKGDAAVVIAIIDTGLLWDDPELTGRLYLNAGELPPPAADPPQWDLNADGAFTVLDYEGLVPDLNDNGLLDPQDLILSFSDGYDDDGNGFVDDICGWDFFEDDNDVHDSSSYFTGQYHGTGQAKRAAAQQDNGIEGCGVCPGCMILPIKDWDSYTVDSAYYGMATHYAVLKGATIIEGAIAGVNNSSLCRDALRRADEEGLPLFMVSSDINSANHNFPTYLDWPIYVSGIVPDTYPIPYIPPTTYFRDSNLTQYGAKNHIAFEARTGSEATALAAGAGGLLLSHARSLGRELHPDQVKQLLTLTAEDVLPENTGLLGVPDPCQPGWDQHFGYGRVNLEDALAALEAGLIPPVARISKPAWFHLMDPEGEDLALTGEILPAGSGGVTWALEAGYGVEPETFVPLAGGNQSGRGIPLGEIDGQTLESLLPEDVDPGSCSAEPDPLDPWEAGIQPNRHLITLRLRVTDLGLGTRGEDRRAIFLHADRHLHAGWPRWIGTGGEASPRFADLDGDNLQEVVIATADGRILIFTHDGRPFTDAGREVVLQSEPLHLALKHGLDPTRWCLRPSFITPSIADIDRDGIKEIVSVAGNKLYAFKSTGEYAFEPIDFSANFFQDVEEARLSAENHIGPGAMASPVLHDLDGDGKREIILGAGDQRVYAWHPDGTAVAGWPVYARSGDTGARIIHPPCIADVDGDGLCEVVVATNEIGGSEGGLSERRGEDLLARSLPELERVVPPEFLPFVMDFLSTLIGKDCLVYAIRPEGTLSDGNPDGAGGREVDPEAFVEGWPACIKTLLPDLLPLVGPSSKPCAFDLDGDGADEVVASCVSAPTTLLGGDGKPLREMATGPMGKGAVGIRDKTLALNMFDSAAIGDITGDGEPEIVKGGITLMGALNLVLAGQNLSYNHILQAWDPQSGAFLEHFPRTIDDFTMYAEPALADVTGDGIPEAISGSGLYLVHAFGLDGQDAPGFPKLTGGWVMTTPASGDIDNDGLVELACVTREGWILVWDTPGRADQKNAWPTYGHDLCTTSNAATDACPPAAITEIARQGDRLVFVCPGDDGFAGRAAILEVYSASAPIVAGALARATLLKELEPEAGGETMGLSIADLEEARAQQGALGDDYLAIVALDEAGNRSQLPLGASGYVIPEESPGGADSRLLLVGDDEDGLCFLSLVQADTRQGRGGP